MVSRLIAGLLIVWLAIGAFAGWQRHDYSGSVTNCAQAGTIAVTVMAGPLNYAGVNPTVSSCHVPQPST
jgi:DNA-binding transcriptional regulator of glucitol operon